MEALTLLPAFCSGLKLVTGFFAGEIFLAEAVASIDQRVWRLCRVGLAMTARPLVTGHLRVAKLKLHQIQDLAVRFTMLLNYNTSSIQVKQQQLLFMA